jgi:hypothetical protein
MPKKSIYTWFPVSTINMTLKLVKEDADYYYMVGGHASHFGDEEDADVSKFKKGVKKNPDHSISINFGIEVYVGNKFSEEETDILRIKLESVILHELNHLYEHYHRKWDPYNRNIQTSITWASLSKAPKDLDKKIFEYWKDKFLRNIYESEPHEVRAQIQEARSLVTRFNIKELKNTNFWKNIKRMQNFDEDKFLDDLHEEILIVNPSLIEEDILSLLIKSWKKEYKKLYEKQIEKNKPAPNFFDKMSDYDFMKFWGKRIRESGDKMVRGTLRQYANKKED